MNAGDSTVFHDRSRPLNAVWIDWGRHLRSRTLARDLGVQLFEITVTPKQGWRYIRSLIRTTVILRDTRPKVVIATNPSIMLGYYLLVLRIVCRFKLVSDAHYYGICAIHGHGLLQQLLNYHNTKVDLVIVTNDGHADRLNLLSARTYVCPDPLPDLPQNVSKAVSVPAASVFLICSFDEDEPYLAVFEAFERLNADGYTLFVSGNYVKAGVEVTQFPWVRFLGFVADQVYYGYLASCSVAMDLTMFEDCLVCGAYEALAYHKPLILSDKKSLRSYFGAGCLYTENTAPAIEEAVRAAFEQREGLVARAKIWVADNELLMQERVAALRVKLSSM